MRVHRCLVVACVTAVLLWSVSSPARGGEKEKVFSGPQVGESVTEFKVIDVIGDAKGREWAVIDRHQGKPLTIVFVHGIERSIVPLLTAIDQYAHEKKDLVGAVIVFLSGDRVESEKRLPLVARSLRLRSPMALSVDGAEGPGNYGLNKQCLMTVVIAKDGKTAANFALVQPGIVDAPAIIAAMAQACGDAKPPTAESLLAERRGSGGAAAGGMAGKGAPQTRPAAGAAATNDLPGAAPADAQLIRLLRSFINKDNDRATVDRLVKEVRAYVKGNPDLTRQAVGGWTRVLYLKYGTEYAQKAGQTMVEELKNQ
jgi:hypothetical protein